MSVKPFDLAMTFDPEVLWPDANDCPDWPLMDENSRRMNPSFSRFDAENRLKRLRYMLNKGTEDLRPPTKAEAEQAKELLFEAGTAPNWRWVALGFKGMRPARRDNDAAEMVLEAVHVRGWLRKLDERAASAAKATAAREQDRLKFAVSTYVDNVEGLKAELASLEEAAARHAQRAADEQAFNRANAIRQSLQWDRSAAVVAAKQLGIELPAE
ncbi:MULTISPECIES: hypothetical protein [Mesorhizobium]|uniref:Uncharacterized protein n=1 Tax=Mesorhizobium denitrificans TaxID=2294114 RepID=A0A371XG15_9HYPH|nr:MULTISPECIES: hypothetical protein [Mesorhizobium]RFC68161.1 hypothetical protein DY251_07755 [Mesorhizobium denitrificans]